MVHKEGDIVNMKKSVSSTVTRRVKSAKVSSKKSVNGRTSGLKQ